MTTAVSQRLYNPIPLQPSAGATRNEVIPCNTQDNLDDGGSANAKRSHHFSCCVPPSCVGENRLRNSPRGVSYPAPASTFIREGVLSCVSQKKKEYKIWRLTIIELPDLGDRCGLQTFSSSFQDNRVLTQHEKKPYRSMPSDDFRSRLPLQRGECKRRAIQATTLCVCPPCVGQKLLRNSPPLVYFLASASTFVRGGVFSYVQY